MMETSQEALELLGNDEYLATINRNCVENCPDRETARLELEESFDDN